LKKIDDKKLAKLAAAQAIQALGPLGVLAAYGAAVNRPVAALAAVFVRA
jgi:hypothetical protein